MKPLPFFVQHVWYIDTITIRPDHFYPYAIEGVNGWRENEPFSWRVPSLRGYAFRLREIK